MPTKIADRVFRENRPLLMGYDPGPRRQARMLDRVVRVFRVIADPRWSALGSLVTAGGGAAWMMVVLLKHVPLVL
jgi:hypothetical protein